MIIVDMVRAGVFETAVAILQSKRRNAKRTSQDSLCRK